MAPPQRMQEGSEQFRLQHLLLCLGIRLALGIDMKLFQVFAPFIAEAWDISLVQFPNALAVGEVAGVLAGLCAPLLRHAEAWQLLFNGLVALSAATVALVLTDKPTLHLFCIERFMFGACRVLVSSAVTAIVGQRVPKNSRGRAIGIIEASYWMADLSLPILGFMLSGVAGTGAADAGMADDLALVARQRHAVHWILSACALAYLAQGIAGRCMFSRPVAAPGDDSNSGYRELQGQEATPPKLGACATIKVLAQPAPLGCILWPLFMQSGMMGVTIVFGVWLHQSFDLNATGVGYAGLSLALGEAIGFVLNLTLTDRIGSTKAVRSGNFVMLLALAALCAQGLLSAPSLWLSLFSFVCIYAAFEFAFVASFTWITEACPQAAGVSQLVMSLICRGASGVGRCIGTSTGLAIFSGAGLAANAGIATLTSAGALILAVWSARHLADTEGSPKL